MMQILHHLVPEAAVPTLRRLQTGVFVLTLLFLNSLNLAAQEQASFSLKLDQARLTEALQQIEDLTNYRFFYDAGVIDQADLVTINLTDASLNDALKAVFSGKNITWEIEGRFIVLSKTQTVEPGDGKRHIKGMVMDEDGLPLFGVTIYLKGTTTGMISGLDGKFDLIIPESGAVLIFRYVGMQEQELTITDQKELSVIMYTDAIGLEEVVAIGYGVQKKRDLTGAVSVVNTDEMKKSTSGSISELLQGQVSGVSVKTTGDPGAGAEVLIRGIGSFSNVGPLYVVDGMILNHINHLNPDDIESMQILKDASAAAIYGSRGGNGVIIITTKKGSAGEHKVNFKASYGVEELSKKIDMMDSERWLYYNQLAYLNAGAEWPGQPALGDTLANTDWQKAIFETGQVMDYNLSFSGGTENDRYMISGGYYSRDGVLVGPWYNRYTFRVNTESKRKRITIGQNLQAVRTNSKITNSWASSFANALTMPPVIPVFDPEEITGRGGYGYGNVKYPTYSINPYALQMSIDDIINYNQLMGNFFLELEIMKGLKYRANLGVDFFHENRKSMDTGATKRYLSVETRWNDKLWMVSNDEINLINEHTLTYDFSFGKHSVTALAGFTTERWDSQSLSNEAYNQIVDGLWQISLAAEQNNMWSSDYHVTRISYLGRINYDYDSKYLVQLNFRRDGSSKFGPSYRIGNFPSASAGWRIYNESFFDPLKNIFSDLKIRGSYGVLGDDQRLGAYNYIASINNSGPYEGYYAVLGADQTVRDGALQSNRVNPYLHWEVRSTANIGVDFGMFRNKLYGTIERYNKISTDLLVDLQLAMATGVGIQPSLSDAIEWTNYGAIQNKGFEFSLGFRNQEGEFNYNIMANVTTLNNTVLRLGLEDSYVDGSYNQVNRTEAGRALAEYYLLETDGIFQSMDEVLAHTTEVYNEATEEYETVLIQPDAKPGDIRYIDYNEDGKIDLDDRQWMGNAMPKLEGSLNLSASYKGFDLTLFFYGVYGLKIFNGVRASIESMDGINNNPDDFYPWTWDNPSETTPRPVFGTTDNANIRSDRWLEDGSYLRLKNFQLGYNVPDKLLKKTGLIGDFRVYVSSQNLLTLTKYKGYDPESMNLDVFTRGCDAGRYPPVRSFIAGVEISF